MHLTSLVVASSLAGVGLATYGLVDDYSGSNFFNKMNFFTGTDPTNGYVSYVSQSTAQSAGLINTNNGVVYMGVDHTNVASGAGRRSVRVSSKNSYTHMLVVANIGHMPGGICGVWPAFWTLGPNWPNKGEIDIIEGVNDQTTNFMTLHTSSGCSFTNQANGQLPLYSQNCDANVNGNEGCSIHDTNTQSYGTGFNGDGGAQFAMEWTSNAISIWWFNRANPAPSDMFGSAPNPANWGKPKAQWSQPATCNIDGHFGSHNLVFDTTFCGAWAGAVWGSDSACTSKASTCNGYVQNFPGAFAPAYWNINALKVYQQNGVHVSKRDNATALGMDEEEWQQHDMRALHDAVAAAKQARAKRAPAYAAQVAPEAVPRASQTVDLSLAMSEATAHPGEAWHRQ